MVTCFYTWEEQVMLDGLKSTRAFRYSLRAQNAQEIASNLLQPFGIQGMLPIKIAQGMTSGATFFAKGMKLHERIVHGIQVGLCALQTGLIISALSLSENCECIDDDTNDALRGLCIAIQICELAYQGVVLAVWVPSELLKESYLTDSTLNLTPGAPVLSNGATELP